jgi:hypothetical protein
MFGADRIDGELGSLLKLGLGEEETAVHFCFHSPAFSLRFSLVTFHYNRFFYTPFSIAKDSTQEA